MKHWLFGLLVSFPMPVLALQLGVPLAASAPLCATKESAIAIAKADIEKGLEAAIETWNKTDDCDRFLTTVNPRKVVYSGKRLNADETVRVVEVEIGGEIFWMLTDGEVTGGQSA